MLHENSSLWRVILHSLKGEHHLEDRGAVQGALGLDLLQHETRNDQRATEETRSSHICDAPVDDRRRIGEVADTLIEAMNVLHQLIEEVKK